MEEEGQVRYSHECLYLLLSYTAVACSQPSSIKHRALTIPNCPTNIMRITSHHKPLTPALGADGRRAMPYVAKSR